MLDSESAFIRSRYTLFKVCLRQQLFKEFCMEKRLLNIFTTANITKLIKSILESSYKVLQVTFKWKSLKQSVYFFKAR